MKLRYWRCELKLAHEWTIARELRPDGGGGTRIEEVVFVELTDGDGVVGLGEASPSARYAETTDTVVAFLEKVDPSKLDFRDVESSMAYLERLGKGNGAAKGALNIALVDGAAHVAGVTVHDYFGLGFTEGQHVTSFSIGIDTPDTVRQKVRSADPYPVLKLKVGGPRDIENLAALREAAPRKPVRLDANEAWKTKEQALQCIERLAADGNIQFIEQPMPSGTPAEDWVWLKARSPIPIMADESYVSSADIDRCAGLFHAVNVKLVKAGGISGAFEALSTARRAGLKTMLGCMIESSVLISAAAHLAELTDYLDLDGNLLITNDPFRGVSAARGVLSFASAPVKTGLQVARASGERTNAEKPGRDRS